MKKLLILAMLVSHDARGVPNSAAGMIATFTLTEMKYAEAEKSPMGMIYRSYRGDTPIISMFAAKSLYFYFSPSLVFPTSEVESQANIFCAYGRTDTFLLTVRLDADTLPIQTGSGTWLDDVSRSAIRFQPYGHFSNVTSNAVHVSDTSYRNGEDVVIEGVARSPVIQLSKITYRGVPAMIPMECFGYSSSEYCIMLRIPVASAYYARQLIGAKVMRSTSREIIGIVTDYEAVGDDILEDLYLILKMF